MSLLGETVLFGSGAKYTIGRVKGIPLRLDATFILVPLALFTAMPSYLDGSLWLAAASGTVGVFLSILLHELGHASVARLHQVGVAEVVVGGFFGYASLKRQAIPRKFRIRILAAGPFTNLVIFTVLWGALAVLSSQGADVLHRAGAPLSWQVETLRALAIVNLAMFVFNLVPAFPLDGGKILGLWLDRSLPLQTSLRIVSALGVAFGIVMIFLGLGISLFLSFIGALVIAANLRRLHRAADSRKSA